MVVRINGWISDSGELIEADPRYGPLGVIEIESQGKASGRGNRHTVRVEAPPGSSIEIVK